MDNKKYPDNRRHPDRRYPDGFTMEDDITVSSYMLVQAKMVLEAEAELQEDENLDIPVIHPDMMPYFRLEWMQSVGLRCLIRAASKLTLLQYDKNRTLRALVEMSQSFEWREMPGGRLPRDFFLLMGREFPDPYLEIEMQEKYRKTFEKDKELIERMVVRL